MSKQEEIINTIRVLRGEIEVLSSRLKEHGTGYIYTTLDVLQSRIEELIEEVTAPYWKDEEGDIGRLPGQTKSSHLRSIEGSFDQCEDVYDGYKEHIEAREYIEENERMEAEALSILAEQSQQSKLREIQDKAAGRKPNAVRDAYLHSRMSTIKDEIEHTDEYYDRNRNKPIAYAPITDPFAEGLSNRSMKQRYGQAVQTTSEMMQEELEPLPFNTFK